MQTVHQASDCCEVLPGAAGQGLPAARERRPPQSDCGGRWPRGSKPGLPSLHAPGRLPPRSFPSQAPDCISWAEVSEISARSHRVPQALPGSPLHPRCRSGGQWVPCSQLRTRRKAVMRRVGPAGHSGGGVPRRHSRGPSEDEPLSHQSPGSVRMPFSPGGDPYIWGGARCQGSLGVRW